MPPIFTTRDIMYTPDKWAVIKITTQEDVLYKVVASFSGGYAHGDSWKINSGIAVVEETEKYYDFIGYSGSVYRCYKQSYGLSVLTAGVVQSFTEQLPYSLSVEVLPEDVDFGCIEYSAVVE